MYNIIQHRRWFYIFSSVLIIPGLISIIVTLAAYGSPVQLSIDFTGGTLWTFALTQPVPTGEIEQVFQDNGFSDVTVRTVENDNTFEIQTDTLTPADKDILVAALTSATGETPLELAYRSIGPAISSQVTRAAFLAVLVASAAILLFIIFAFRNLSHSIRYGVCAIIAMLHDILITLGIVSILGWTAGWKADALTLTALLTIIGFSVQDTIVVFDRIRENSRRRRGEDFETIVNRSLLETLHRSLATQLSALFVLSALILFGGVTIRQFALTLFIGLLSGTYSSIFNATPLVVSWDKGAFNLRRFFGSTKRTAAPA